MTAPLNLDAIERGIATGHRLAAIQQPTRQTGNGGGNHDVGGGFQPAPTPAFNPGIGYRPCQDPNNNPRWWYWPGETGITAADADKAKFLCGTCKVQLECASWALTAREQYLIWGGLDPMQRNKMLGHGRRGRRRANSHTETNIETKTSRST